MPHRVAILQSNYVPWKGYFDIIHDVDEFIFLDDVQYTKQSWRNRNRIKTERGAVWLTIPVGPSLKRRICDVELPSGWAEDHWRRIERAYSAAPHFATYGSFIHDLYSATWTRLSDFNQRVIVAIAHDLLGLTTRFRDSRELELRSANQDRVIEALQRTGADVYVSGPAAKSYLDPPRFEALGIDLVWKSYEGYPEYRQYHPPFRHDVTILDLLFHTGGDAPHYIWGWR
jgi:hypothetical protein